MTDFTHSSAKSSKCCQRFRSHEIDHGSQMLAFRIQIHKFITKLCGTHSGVLRSGGTHSRFERRQDESDELIPELTEVFTLCCKHAIFDLVVALIQPCSSLSSTFGFAQCKQMEEI